MDIEFFWSLIETSRAEASDCEQQASALTGLLTQRKAHEIAEFDRLFEERLDQSFRWDLWAVVHIVHGGCSADNFEHFRGWLIAQGRAYFERALNDPRAAADAISPGGYAMGEDMLYAAANAYAAVTGKPLPEIERNDDRPCMPAGDAWHESEICGLYPALAEKFGRRVRQSG